MNTPKQNEYLVRWCLEHQETERFYGLLENGVTLSAFTLTCMVFFGYKDYEIKEAVRRAENVSKDVFGWLKKRFKLSEISGILSQFEVPQDLFSEKEMIELKMWQQLAKKQKWGIIAQHAPEFLEQMTENEEAMKALLKVNFNKYAQKALNQGMLSAIISVKDGWKYLLEQGKKDYVLRVFKSIGTIFTEAEMADACEYIKEKGLIDELYKKGAYEFLLINKITEPFISHHSTWWRFLEKYPELVQWEELWKHHPDKRDVILYEARKNKEVPVCKEFIAKHTGILSIFHR